MKDFKKLISIVLLILGICLIFPNIAFSLDYENGNFEQINTNLSVRGCPLKLQDGKIFILDTDKAYIFNPNTNLFQTVKSVPFGFSYFSNRKTFPAVVLNNGKVFIIGSVLKPPSEKFEDELFEPLMDLFAKRELKENKSFLSLSFEERNSIIVSKWKTYRQLTEEEKEKFYLPIIQQNEDFLNRYKKYCQLWEKSKQALLFDPITGVYESINNFIITGNSTAGFIPIIKSNDEILIFSQQGEVSKYNFNTKKYFILNTNKKFNNIEDIQKLDNNELLLLSGGKYCFYNLDSNKYSDIQRVPIPLEKFSYITKLNNSELIVFGNSQNQDIYIYNFINKNLKKINKFINNRYLEQDSILSSAIVDKKYLFIFGGVTNSFQKGLLNTQYKNLNNAELVNLQTNEIKLFNMKFYHSYPKNVILNDGRILIFENNDSELYVPKGYVK